MPFVLPEPLSTWLGGAAFNVGWLAVYALSTALLWRGDTLSPAVR